MLFSKFKIRLQILIFFVFFCQNIFCQIIPTEKTDDYGQAMVQMYILKSGGNPMEINPTVKYSKLEGETLYTGGIIDFIKLETQTVSSFPFVAIIKNLKKTYSTEKEGYRYYFKVVFAIVKDYTESEHNDFTIKNDKQTYDVRADIEDWVFSGMNITEMGIDFNRPSMGPDNYYYDYYEISKKVLQKIK